MIGIYKITNQINNKSYIGQSVNINRRWAEHRMLGRDESLSLKRAMRKYGIENFTFEVLEECLPEELDAREIFYISLHLSEYNRTTGGCGVPGRRLSSEVKEILRTTGKSQWQNMTIEQQRKQIYNILTGPAIGHSVSEETREKLRAANTGKKQSRKTIEKRIDSIKNNGRVRTCVWCNKKIYCCDLDQTFESVKSAAEYLEISPSSISANLKGTYKTAHGHRFTYVV
jgi:group I intron endonuclease